MATILPDEPVVNVTEWHVQIRRHGSTEPWHTYDRCRATRAAVDTRADFDAGRISVGWPPEVRIVRVTVTTVIEEVL